MTNKLSKNRSIMTSYINLVLRLWYKKLYIMMIVYETDKTSSLNPSNFAYNEKSYYILGSSRRNDGCKN